MAGKSKRAHKPWTNSFHLKMTLEAVEVSCADGLVREPLVQSDTYTCERAQNVCATYGILSALMLTMNVSAFGSMSVEEWELFEKGLATERCNGSGGGDVNLGRFNTTQECVDYISHVSEVWCALNNHGRTIMGCTTTGASCM